MRIKETTEEIKKEFGITKVKLSVVLGYKNTSSYFTAITNESVPRQKIEILCDTFGYVATYDVFWTFKKK